MFDGLFATFKAGMVGRTDAGVSFLSTIESRPYH